MDAKYWITLAAVVAVAIAMLVYWMLKERKVIAGKKEVAAQRGWSYSYLKPAMFFRYRNLPFIDVDAKSRMVKHFVSGQHRGRPVTLFTYQYSVSRKEVVDRRTLSDDVTAERTKRRRHGVVSVGLPTEVPALEVAPRGAIHERARRKGLSVSNLLGEQAAALLGGAIDTGDEPFDQAFVVKSRDPGFARRLLSADVRAWMLASGDARKRAMVIKDDEIITWDAKTDLESGIHKADYLNDVVERVPAEVVTK